MQSKSKTSCSSPLAMQALCSGQVKGTVFPNVTRSSLHLWPWTSYRIPYFSILACHPRSSPVLEPNTESPTLWNSLRVTLLAIPLLGFFSFIYLINKYWRAHSASPRARYQVATTSALPQPLPSLEPTVHGVISVCRQVLHVVGKTDLGDSLSLSAAY